MPYSGERANNIRVRVGVDVNEFQGMNTEREPASLPVTQFVELVNVRHDGGKLVNRKGLTKVNSGGAITGTPTGAGGNDYGYLSSDY
jgi:hypothetical protein